MSGAGRPVVHEVMVAGFCRVCGEVRDWLEDTGAAFVEV
jgi:hypothetical protein